MQPRGGWQVQYNYDFTFYNIIDLVYFTNSLAFVLANWGPGFGEYTRGPLRYCLTGAACGTRAAPGFCVCRRWTFPYAGGELAPRGPCPTLVLYLFKEINPPDRSILIFDRAVLSPLTGRDLSAPL